MEETKTVEQIKAGEHLREPQAEDDYHRTQRLTLEDVIERLTIVEEKLSKRGRPPKDMET